MKKLTATLLLWVLILSTLLLSGCGDNFYEPVPSTEEEATTVMTLKIGNKSYEVKYELYRAIFLNFKSEVDGGDASVWSGADKDKYIAEIDKIILDYVTDIYATFYLAESVGIDPYSEDIGREVNEYINTSIEGGTINGETYEGYESYEAYLEKLTELHLNYSVQSLLFRYSIVLDKLDDHYLGDYIDGEINDGDQAGALPLTEQLVRSFYDSDECVRVLRTYISESMSEDPNRPQVVRDAVAESAANGSEDHVRETMIKYGALIPIHEMENGYIVGKYNLDESFFGKMVDAAFALETGEVSEVVTVHDGLEYYHYVIYRAEKSDEHFKANYSSIAYIYLKNEVGKLLNDTSVKMTESVVRAEFLNGLVHSEISMKK